MTQITGMRNTKFEIIGLGTILILYTLIAFAHAYYAPLTTGPDELAHYEYVRFIADQKRLPLDNSERDVASYKSDQPPLYHLVAAIPSAFVDSEGPPTLKRVGDHPRRQLIERTRHFWGLYNTEDEQWPFQAEILRWHVGRWVAIVFGAATVLLTYFIAREIFKESAISQSTNISITSLSLIAAAIVAFTPRFMLTGSMLNYETAMAFFAALFLWVLIRLAKTQRQMTSDHNASSDQRNFLLLTPYFLFPILLGLFTGLAVTAKLSAVILPLEIMIALWLIKRHYTHTWMWWWRNLIITGIATVIAVSWWFGFIAYQFNTIPEEGWWAGTLRPLIAADASDATTNRIFCLLTGGGDCPAAKIENLDSGPPWEWAATTFRTFWVAGIEGQQPLGIAGLIIAFIFCLTAIWGLIHHSPLILHLLLLHLTIPILLPLIRYAVTFSLADTAQGRHILFAAAPAFAILLVWGWSSVIRQSPISNLQSLKLPVSFLPALFLLVWSFTQLWTMTWAYHPLLPVQTASAMSNDVEVILDEPLNDYVTLVGYTQEINEDLLKLDLIWRGTQISPVDYLTEVTLRDQMGEAQTQWLGYPANGRYPTRAWDVDDIVRDTIWLPLSGLSAGQYRLELNLIATTLNLPAEVSAQLEKPFALSEVALSQDVPAASQPQIWRQGLALDSSQTLGYRETILVNLSNDLSDQPIHIVGPLNTDYQQTYSLTRQLNKTVLFSVGADWPTGDYQLQIGSEGQLFTSEPFHVIDRWERQFYEPPITQRVEANFANRIKLIGYDLQANRAAPGGGIPITLYWQGLDWMGTNYTMFAKLLSTDQIVHGGRDRLPQEGYSTLYWAPGEVIPDSFGVPVNDDAPDGIYTVSVGLYEQVGEQAVSLPLVQDGQLLDVTSINIGPIKIGNAPAGFVLDEADPQVVINQSFGDGPNLTLLGYDQSPIANNQLPITLYWRSESPLPADYTTFVHVRNRAGENVAQKDQRPLNGAYPTSLWDSGEIISDEILIPLPEGLSNGDYEMVVGLYDLQTQIRLNLTNSQENELNLTRLIAKK